MTIFELRRAYHDSMYNIRDWMEDSSVSGRLTRLDRLSILDAWHQEMVEFFQSHGHCFTCSRPTGRCRCPEDVRLVG